MLSSVFDIDVIPFLRCLGIHKHREYGRKSKLKHGNLLLMLFILKGVSSFVRSGMWEGSQTQVWFLENHSLAHSMPMNIEEFLNY